MLIQPYIFFDGGCEEAAEFYRHALGAEVTALVRFKDSPDPGMCPGRRCWHPTGDAKESRASRDFRSRLRWLVKPMRSGCSELWPKAGKYKCRWPRPSFLPASAWSPTVSGCHG
ncbi:MAG: hypothetical protein K0S79_2975 [Nitrospira sp.]|nr:hypothetical protein [Nitrospira sp.]